MNKEGEQFTASNIDGLLPPEMAIKAEDVGVKKVNLNALSMLGLAILAGAFIALGSVFYTTVTADLISYLPYGLVKLVGGLVFCLGLILVIVAGAELFTGNALIIMAWAGKKISTRKLLHNWGLVYVGNFLGSIITVLLVMFSKQYMFNDGKIGMHMLNIASGKCQLEWFQAVALGVLCNALVCLAVWLCFSARTATDKILAIIFPITAFVAAGFEHSIANMYFIPAGLILKFAANSEFWLLVESTPAEFLDLTWSNFLFNNLIPVTIGNVIGGGLLVGIVYWFIYRRPLKEVN